MLTAAFWTYSRIVGSYDHLPAVIAVPCRNTVSPPELAADTPVTDVVRPIKVGLFHALWQELNLAVFYAFYCRLNHLVHFYKPLLLNHRFYCRMAAVMCSYIMCMRLYLNQKPLCFKVCNKLFSALIAVHACILARPSIHGCIVIDYNNLFEIMALSYLKIVRVMCRSNLYTSGSEFFVYIGIRNYRNFPVCHWKLEHFSNDILITLILRIYCNRSISK